MGQNFRKNLREELDYQGMTVKELALKSLVAKGALDSYLGKQGSMPPADAALRIAAALGVTVEYLIKGEENRQDKAVSFFNPRKRLILRIFDELDSKDQKLALDFVKLLKKNREEGQG
jgi:transcriptional regulator with XRE-family HTH domain